MKRCLFIVLVLILATACSGQKQLDLFDSNANIDSFVVSNYFPFYSGILPEPIRVINIKTEIDVLKQIINRALLVEKIVDNKTFFNDPKVFDFEISVVGENIVVWQIYVLIDGDDIFLTSLSFCNQDEQGCVMYQIRSSDIDEFIGFLE